MTIEEIRTLDNDALKERMASIKAELENEDADLEALNSEIDAIEERKASIKAEVEERAKVIEEVIATPVAEPVVVEERKMTNLEVRDSKEYINAFAEYVKSNDDAECRALLTEGATDGVVPVPSLVDDIVRHAWDRDGIIARVKKSYLKGNVRIGFEVSADGAVIHTEGDNAPTEEKLVLGVVELVPQSIKKWITISDEAMDLKGQAFLEYIYAELTYQIAKKAVDTLIAKINACGATSTTTPTTNVAVPVVSLSSASVGDVASAIALLSDEAVDPIVVLNKGGWAEYKKAQYANEFNVDPFEGLPVEFNNTLKTFATATTGETIAIVGDFGNGALMNFPNGQNINIKFDDLSLAEKDLVKIVGREFVGMGVVAPAQFVRIVKASAE